MTVIKDYLKNIPNDIERLDGRKRDIRKIRSLLRALGRAESTTASIKSLQKDIDSYPEDRENGSMAISTISES